MQSSEVQTILREMESVLEHVRDAHIDRFVETLKAAKRIFTVGEGRSGFMAKSFAMRLMHLGANVYVVGETITPALETDDVLVATSGSGTTKSVLMVAQKAKELGCQVIAVTTNPDSELAALATLVVHVPAATKYRLSGEGTSIQPLGSLFDQCAHILYDAVCLRYANVKSVSHNAAFAKHSNLE